MCYLAKARKIKGQTHASAPAFQKQVALRLTSDRVDVDAAAVLVEADVAVFEGEEAPIAAGADVGASHPAGAALADDDAAGADQFAAKSFHAKSFADAVASVA